LLVCYVTAFARFGLREQFKQQGAKSVNGPSFVCSLYSLGLCGNGIHIMYATYMVYVVQKCSLYGRLYNGFVLTWKSTLR
jgi:hypothetical protein